MAELRRDPFLDRWTLIAAERSGRPRDHRHAPATPAKPNDQCPFCPGREEDTPPEIDAIREDESVSSWRIRVIPNLYPAIGADPLSESLSGGLFDSMSGGGRHEVIVDSPDHLLGLADLPDAHAGEVLRMLQRRVRELYTVPSIRSVAPFKNHGALAGASLEHSHLQVVGLPAIPPYIALEREAAEHFHRDTGKTLLDEMVEWETKQNRRTIETGERGAVVYCPFASRFPFQVAISPWPTQERFAESPPGAIAAVGGALARSLRRIKNLLGDPPLNVFFHVETRPEPGENTPAHRWRIEIFPRLADIAGLEIGSGMHINEMAPERAAETLREISF